MIVTTFSTIIHTELLRADKETLAEAMGKKWCLNCKTETNWWYGCLNTEYCTRCAHNQNKRVQLYKKQNPTNVLYNFMYVTCCLSEECPLKRMFGFEGGTH